MTTFRLPSSGTYTARQLIYAVKHAKSAPPDTRYLVGEWSHPMTPREYIGWFRRKLHEKINSKQEEKASNWTKAARHGKSVYRFIVPLRKLSSEYQLSLRRDAVRLTGYPDLGRKLETPEIRKRLGTDHVHVFGSKVQLCGDVNCD